MNYDRVLRMALMLYVILIGICVFIAVFLTSFVIWFGVAMIYLSPTSSLEAALIGIVSGVAALGIAKAVLIHVMETIGKVYIPKKKGAKR